MCVESLVKHILDAVIVVLLLTFNLICNIRSNFTHSLEKKTYSFIYNALHHPNELIRLLLHVKLASANSVFAEFFCYLSFKYQITREDCITE